MQSRFAIDFLPRNKWLLNFMAAVTLCSDFGAQDIYLEFDIIYIWLMYILIRHIIYLLNVWLSKWLRFHGSSQPKEIYNVVQEIKNHYDEMPLKWGEWQWGQKMHLEGRGDGLWGQLRLHGWAGSRNHWDPAPWFFPPGGSPAFSFWTLSAPITNISPASIWDLKNLKISYSHLGLSLLDLKPNMLPNLHRMRLTHVNRINKKRSDAINY